MCTPRDDRSNARSTHADSPALLRGHSQPSASGSWNGSVESTTPTKREPHPRMANPCQVCEGLEAKRYGVPPQEDFRAHFREHHLEGKIDETEPESTGTRPQHLESTSNIIIRQGCLESTSNNFSRRHLSASREDGTWNPPVTPREGQLRCYNINTAAPQHPQVMTKSVRHRMHRLD